MITIKATSDGTYTVYRNGLPFAWGLTREQAEQFART